MNYYNEIENYIKKRDDKERVKYGSCYDATNLKIFRKFYLCFQKNATLSYLLLSYVVELLPITDENKINYYINRCIEKNLSIRELKK